VPALQAPRDPADGRRCAEYGYSAAYDVEGYEPGRLQALRGSGYRGRTGIYEVMTISPEMRALRARTPIV